MALKSIIKNFIAQKAERDYSRKLAKAFPPYEEWESRREFSFASLKKGDKDKEMVTVSYDEISVPKLRNLAAEENKMIIFHSSSGRLSSAATVLIREFFDRNPEISLLYGDEDDGMIPFFKPDWSPDRFCQCFYIGSVFAVRSSFLKQFIDSRVEELGFEDTERIPADILFGRMAAASGGFEKRRALTAEGIERAALNVFGYNEMNFPIGHIDEILFHRNEGTDLYYGRDLKSPGLMTGTAEDISGRDPEICDISVIIPSKDNPELLKQCLDSLYSICLAGKYPEVIVVDNGSTESAKKELEAYFEDMRNKGMPVKYIYEAAPFNFSHMCNSGADAAGGRFLLFLNDDTEFTKSSRGSVISKDGTLTEKNVLEEMAELAARPYAGAVGAKLCFPFDTADENAARLIQHAGVVNVRMNPWHILKGLDDREEHYFGYNRGVLNVSAVTGACLMVAAGRFRSIGGFAAELPVNFNDTDLCYRLLEEGFYNIECNDLFIIHHESVSRGNDELSEEAMERLTASQNVLRERHPGMMNEDPFYSGHFNKATGLWPFTLEEAPEYTGAPVKNADDLFSEGMKDKWLNDVLRVGVDNAGPYTDHYKIKHPLRGLGASKAQAAEFVKKKGRLIFIDGYSFVIGSDNALFERRIVLMGEDGECRGHFLTVSPEDVYRKDIEANTHDQINTAMAGFRAVIRVEDLLPGTYSIGILASGISGRMKLLNFGKRKLTV